MDDIVLVEVVDSLEDLSDGPGGVLFSKLSLLADAVEELSTSRKFGHDVVLVLAVVSPQTPGRVHESLTLDSNQS